MPGESLRNGLAGAASAEGFLRVQQETKSRLHFLPMFRWLTERRRRHLLERPFPAAWRETLERRVAAYKLLDESAQERLRQLVQVFVAEKDFEGCGGLELSDEIRVTIAGSACLMLLGRDHDLFADVSTILVYPSTYVVPPRRPFVFERSMRPIADEEARLGEASRGGPVVLAWDAVVKGAADGRDGRNVVIHEMAHKIDFLDGAADGTPPLDGRAARRAWAAACSRAFLDQRERIERGEPSFLRDYAATNEAEFFAVASESFFERPAALARELPDLYAVLRDFYGLDLARVTSGAAG
jgi:Mlc titration factor MtfA (ptsG expression regulator)